MGYVYVAGLTLLLLSLLTPSPVGAQESSADAGTVTVTVERVTAGGAPPAPGLPQAAASTRSSPVTGVAVRAAPVGAPAIPATASATTADTGEATLTLPPGAYVLYVPVRDCEGAEVAPGAIVQQLPDGTLVHAQTRVDVAPNSNTAVTLSLRVPMP